MEVLKNNKGIFITLGIIIVLLITGLILIRAFFPSGNVYGNRLKGIDKVPFSKKEISKIESDIKDKEKVEKVEIDIKGRLINIIITVGDISLEDMKDYCLEKLDLFDKDEKAYYDIQFYLINEDEKKEEYPSIGYKHKSTDNIKWSNN